MPEFDAIEMLVTIGGLHDPSARELEGANKVVEELDEIPFFIKMAAKCIRKHQYSTNDYWRFCKTKKLRLGCRLQRSI